MAIHIEDTGPGVGKAELESVFDAFFTTRATGAGTGLALTVARKIIELHKGQIVLQSLDGPAPGRGVRASIFLKLAGALRTAV